MGTDMEANPDTTYSTHLNMGYRDLVDWFREATPGLETVRFASPNGEVIRLAEWDSWYSNTGKKKKGWNIWIHAYRGDILHDNNFIGTAIEADVIQEYEGVIQVKVRCGLCDLPSILNYYNQLIEKMSLDKRLVKSSIEAHRIIIAHWDKEIEQGKCRERTYREFPRIDSTTPDRFFTYVWNTTRYDYYCPRPDGVMLYIYKRDGLSQPVIDEDTKAAMEFRVIEPKRENIFVESWCNLPDCEADYYEILTNIESTYSIVIGAAINKNAGYLEIKAQEPPGRHRYPENEWARQQVHEQNRNRNEVFPEWLERGGARIETLANPRDSFNHMITTKPRSKPKPMKN